MASSTTGWFISGHKHSLDPIAVEEPPVLILVRIIIL